MSTATAPETEGFVDTSHVGDAAEESGGSQTSEQVPADGAQATTEEGAAEGQPEVAAKPEPSADAERIRELEAENANRQAIIEQVIAQAQADPYIAEKFGFAKTGVTTPPRDAVEEFEAAVRDPEKGFNRESADSLMVAFKPILKELQRLREEVGGAKRDLGSVQRTVGSGEYSRALAARVPAQAQGSKEFQRLEKQLRGQSWFASLQATNAQVAAEVIGDKWTALNAQRAGWKDQRAQLESAKSGGTGAGPTRGSSVAEKVYQIKRSSVDPIAEAYKVRLKDPKARVEYVP